MTISNFERFSGDIVQRDMSLIWWAGITFKCSTNRVIAILVSGVDGAPFLEQYKPTWIHKILYKYVYFNFHTISSPIKHANYKAKVEMDI